jgi:hypothetical protein
VSIFSRCLYLSGSFVNLKSKRGMASRLARHHIIRFTPVSPVLEVRKRSFTLVLHELLLLHEYVSTGILHTLWNTTYGRERALHLWLCLKESRTRWLSVMPHFPPNSSISRPTVQNPVQPDGILYILSYSTLVRYLLACLCSSFILLIHWL